MNFLVLLLIAFVSADDVYSPFKRSCVIQSRINSVNKETKKLNDEIDSDNQKIADLENTLQYFFRDLKYATTAEDRNKLEMEIESTQKKLHELRLHKVEVFRDMRRSTDKITNPFRDNIVRNNRVEGYVGLENSGNFVGERLKTQEAIKVISEKLATKYATLAAKIASKTALPSAQNKFKNNMKKIEEHVAKKAGKAYSEMYSKIVELINTAMKGGVSRKDVKDLAQSAIEEVVATLNKKYSSLPNTTVAEKIAKKIVKQQMKKTTPKKGKTAAPKKGKTAAPKKAGKKAAPKKAAPKKAGKK
ncbi:Uncharacterized protein QTN25_006234 [Entamoeba marina]